MRERARSHRGETGPLRGSCRTIEGGTLGPSSRARRSDAPALARRLFRCLFVLLAAQLSRPNDADRHLWGNDEPSLCVSSPGGGRYSDRDQCRILLRARKFRISSFNLGSGDFLQWVSSDETAATFDTCDMGTCGGDWSRTMDNEGWSSCTAGCALTGLRRVGGSGLDAIDKGKSCKVAVSSDCQEVDISSSFDREGWAECPDDKYLAGLYRSESGRIGLGYLEKVNCCGDPGLTLTGCTEYSIRSEFDHAGTVKCPGNQVIKGFYRSGNSGTDPISYIETLRCCDVDQGVPVRRDGYIAPWDHSKTINYVHEGTEARPRN